MYLSNRTHLVVFAAFALIGGASLTSGCSMLQSQLRNLPGEEASSKNSSASTSTKETSEADKSSALDNIYAACQEAIELAESDVKDSEWVPAERDLTEYYACRREFITTGGDVGRFAELDTTYKGLLTQSADGLLVEIEERRKKKKFKRADYYVRLLVPQIMQYRQIIGQDAKSDEVIAKVDQLYLDYPGPMGDLVEESRQKYLEWHPKVVATLEEERAAVKAAEQKAKPTYEAGVAALESKDYETALSKLHEARRVLYTSAYPTGEALDTAFATGNIHRGLAYEISTAIARAHQARGTSVGAYPELATFRKGHAWLETDEALAVRKLAILEDREGVLEPIAYGLVPDYVNRYSTIGTRLNFLTNIAEDKIERGRVELSFESPVIEQRKVLDHVDSPAGKVVKVNDQVTGVDDTHLTINRREKGKIEYNCRNTGRMKWHPIPRQWLPVMKCDYKDGEWGYVLQIPKPEGVEIKKGDYVTLYAPMTKKEGEYTVHFDQPAVERVVSGDKIGWYKGVEF